MSTIINNNNTKKVYTITFGDVAENHAKMQKIGTLHESGYSISQLEHIQNKLTGYGIETEMVDLNAGFDDSFQKAKVLVIRRGAQHILGEETAGLMQENDNLTMDKKAFMKGKVVNKVARWNLCFADEDQEPNYEDGKGRVVAWKHIPRMAHIRQVISEWTEDVLLNGEANYYYDISLCGIGFHGDGERRKVFAVRMGETMPLYFKWFQNSQPIGEPIELVLNDGDMYIMSEKAVGFDWLKKKIATLRHSTGCAKFTGVKNQQEKTAVPKKASNKAQEKALKQQQLAQKKQDKEQEKALKAQEAQQKKEQKTQELQQKVLEKEQQLQQKKQEKEQQKTQKALQKEQQKTQKALQKEQQKTQKALEKASKKVKK